MVIWANLSGGHWARCSCTDLKTRMRGRYLRGNADELCLQVRLNSCQGKEKISTERTILIYIRKMREITYVPKSEACVNYKDRGVTYYPLGLLPSQVQELLLACSTSQKLPLCGFQGRGTPVEKPGCWWHPLSCSP